MLDDDMKLWHGLRSQGCPLILQSCLLAAITCLLGRHMANKNERNLKRARHQAPRPSPTHQHPPAAKGMKGTLAERSTPASEPRHRHVSNPSSDSSDSNDSSPPTRQDTKHVNYTQVTFSDPGGLENDSALDYENMKEATDYVNVNPKSHKPNLWTFVNPAVSEQVEYTQVAL
nr:LOW QUALITY PROTEIN: regulator of hemoglobinization and erythroid cell expansion protein [Equus asinus]